MRNAVRVVVVVLATVVLLESAIRWLEPAWPEVNVWREPLVAAKVRRMEALGREGAVDVAFAGSSQMLFAGDPRMLRRDLGVRWTSYNAALWGAPPVVNEHWLLSVVEPRLRPKAVVLGVSPVDFVESDTDLPVRNYFNSLAVRGDWIGMVEREAFRRSALVRHRRSMRSIEVIAGTVMRKLRGETGPPVPRAGLDAFGRLGNRDSDRFRGDAAARELIAGIVRNGWAPSEEQRLAFRRTIRGLKARGAEVIVADMAVSAPMIELLGGERSYEEFKSFLEEETDEEGVPLLDTAEGVTDTRFFFDFDHVNRAGADVFNTALGRLLGGSQPEAFASRLGTEVTERPLAPTLAADVVARRSGAASAVASQPPAPTAAPVETPAVPAPPPLPPGPP